MADPTVDDMGPAHALAHRIHTAVDLGIIPPLMMPSFFSMGTSLTLTTGIKVPSSSLSRSNPLTSVIKINFIAPSLAAMLAAATSA